MSQQIARLFAWIALVVLTSVANPAMPANLARADDCRSTPNSPAPARTHWYYRLEWETQRKCWYVRAPGRRAHQATRPATVMPTTASHAAPARLDPRPIALTSPSPSDTTWPSPQAKTSAVRAISAPVSGGTIDEIPQRSAPDQSSAPSQEASTPGAQEAALRTVGAPDRAISDTSSETQESATPTRAFDEAKSNARSSGPIDDTATPMIICPVLALGLALLGIGSRFLIKYDAARPAQVDDQGWHKGRDGPRLQKSVPEEQEFHSFVSVVSDPGTLQADGDSVKITREISKRRHKLAQLRQHIECTLRSATGPHAQPLQEQIIA
jgi:hypothetical protein